MVSIWSWTRALMYTRRSWAGVCRNTGLPVMVVWNFTERSLMSRARVLILAIIQRAKPMKLTGCMTVVAVRDRPVAVLYSDSRWTTRPVWFSALRDRIALARMDRLIVSFQLSMELDRSLICISLNAMNSSAD